MKSTIKNFSIAFGLFTLLFMVGTCHVHQNKSPETIPIDTLLFNSYKEKVNALQLEFNKQVIVLTNAKDSLQSLVKGNKKAISILKFQSQHLERSIKKAFNTHDSCFVNDSLKTTTLSYIAIQNERDSICNESVNTLELIASKQDSIVLFKNKECDNLKDLLKQNDLREKYLTEQLNTAYKQQRKILIRNKFCLGALYVMAGVTSALLINQTLK
jgi:hypothetical protein